LDAKNIANKFSDNDSLGSTDGYDDDGRPITIEAAI
jgi:hypothetical protein